jgi:hypothetical protein
MAGTTTYFGISYPTSTDLVKDGAANMQTIATGFDSAVAIPNYNNQTGTTYTFALSDIGKTVTASNAGSQTYTIPPTASVTWPTNATLRVINLGAGVVTFAAGAGVTVTNTAQTLTQYQSARLVRTALNAWTVTPDSGAASASGLTLVSETTITAAATTNIDGVFTSTYENYMIVLNCTSAGTTEIGTKLRSGGVTNTDYHQWWGWYQGSGTPYTNITGATAVYWNWAYALAGEQSTSAVATITAPQVAARRAQWFGQHVRYSTASGVGTMINGSHVATGSFDGIQIYATANLTGTVRIYGLRNS